PGVYVSDPGEDDVAVPELISEATRAAAVAHLWHAFRVLEQGRRLDVVRLQDAVDNIVDEILAEPQVLKGLADLRSHDMYTFGHSVDVCALSVAIGRALNLPPEQLRVLGLGALLHDIGKIGVPAEILRKPGRLTAEEWRYIYEHPRLGFDILRRYHEVPVPAAHVAYQHHERLDGSGYPRGLAGDQVHPYGRIAAVADVFDAMCSLRTYRPGFPVHEVLAFLQDHSGTLFDPDAVACLGRIVAPYPLGTTVRLNTGEIGLVVALVPEDGQRPTVRILRDADGRVVDARVYRELHKDPSVSIVAVVDLGELADGQEEAARE
ncbi:MAG TPA: HD-GYP domain-containing protein, partial [Limnochordales bacterium]